MEDEKYASGFFCKIKDPKDEDRILKVLFTCNHVLNKETLINDKQISLEINGFKKTLILKNRKIWTNNNFNLDYTCIEILKNDEIKYFLNVDENITDYNYTLGQYKNKGIYIFGIMKDLQLGFDSGSIQNVQNFLMTYNCNTDPSCSGGVIINKKNNCAIGIHKGAKKNKKFNMGIYMRSIIDDIKDNNYFINDYKEINKNYRFKVIVFGNQNSGKTNIFNKIIDGNVNDPKDYGLIINNILIKINKNNIHLLLYDLTGVERYRAIIISHVEMLIVLFLYLI